MFITGVSWFQVNAAIWKPRIVSVTRKTAIANQIASRTKRRSRAAGVLERVHRDVPPFAQRKPAPR